LDILTANDRPGEYPPSWYAATAEPLLPFPAADGDMRADVCVIGGGYTGLSAALHLAEAGLSVVLVEAHRVGWGASGRNGGQIGPGQRIGQDVLEARLGREHAHMLWDQGLEALSLVHDLIARHGIDCELAEGVIHADHRPRFVPHSHAYAEKLMHDYGYGRLRVLDRAGIQTLVGSEDYHGGVLDEGAGHLHPLKYALGLARAAEAAGVRIHERSRVQRIRRGDPATVETDQGRVRAGHVILAANGYLGGLERETAARVMPINNFIVATEPLGAGRAREIIAQNHAVADSRFVINYFRLTPDHRLLFGGGESYNYRFPRDIAAKARRPMLKVFPQLAAAAITHAWGGTLAITMSRLPYLTRLAPNILCAGGYSGHGVALASHAGRILARAVQGQAGRFDVFASIPARRFPGGLALRTPLLALAMLWHGLRDRV